MKGWQWDWRITLSLCEGLAVVGLENNVEFMRRAGSGGTGE